MNNNDNKLLSLAYEKLYKLEEALIRETDPASIFRLQQQLVDLKQHIKQIEQSDFTVLENNTTKSTLLNTIQTIGKVPLSLFSIIVVGIIIISVQFINNEPKIIKDDSSKDNTINIDKSTINNSPLAIGNRDVYQVNDIKIYPEDSVEVKQKK